MILDGREVPGRPADLPQALVWFAPVPECRFDLMPDHRPAPLVEPVTGAGVQVEGVEQDAPDVVLALVPCCVADAHRPGSRIAGQVIKLGFS
jgi:hypothetical protein